MSKKPLHPDFFAQPAVDAAQSLIGTIMQVGRCQGRIVEVEAYTDDEASHGYRRTARSNIMHDTYGMVYVYLIYGMYYCVNFTADRRHVGAILIRAVEPLRGISLMKTRRDTDDLKNLCSGPGKLTRSFGIDNSLNWTAVGQRIKLYEGDCGEIISSKRIGITKATHLPWRFYERNNDFVSRAK